MTYTNGQGGSALPSLSDQKAAARRAAFKRRERCDPASGGMLAEHLLAAGLIPPDAIVAGFWPLPGEIDIRTLLLGLHASGHRLALPQTPARGVALSFHGWAPGDRLVPGRFGTMHPDSPAVTPGALLVPLLAFDAGGGRLGYGGGYYDRTLAALPGVPAIGCAFSVQMVDRVPTGPHDIHLAAIVTERGVHHPA